MCTVVSVHIRMGDYARHLNLTGWGPEITKTDYISKVIELVRQTYPVGTLKQTA